MNATEHAAPAAPAGATFGSELLASVVVFLVALPLCLGIAIACGAPAAAGLATGIVGGILVGMLAGSPLQVSGPAAGLTTLVFAAVQQLGMEKLGAVVLIAGAVQLVAAALRLGGYFRRVPHAVVEGMLAGIGILIVASQLQVAIDAKPHGEGRDNLAAIPAAFQTGLAGGLPGQALACAAAAFAAILAWMWFGAKRLPWLPAPLVGVVVGAGLAIAAGWGILRVEVPADLLGALTPFWRTDGSAFREWPVWQAGLIIAVVASAESLLCAAAVDRMHQGPRTQYDRELAAQGAGNAVCGLLGALPLTGVIVRSAANVQAGAKSRWSAVLHGVWLLLCVAVGAAVLNAIPKAALAAVLIHTGLRLVKPRAVAHLWKHHGFGNAVVYVVTAALVVLKDLLSGVIAGLVLWFVLEQGMRAYRRRGADRSAPEAAGVAETQAE